MSFIVHLPKGGFGLDPPAISGEEHRVSRRAPRRHRRAAYRDGAEYPKGPGSSTVTEPSASTMQPRAAVSWRTPEPSGRIAKIWPAKALSRRPPQAAWNTI